MPTTCYFLGPRNIATKLSKDQKMLNKGWPKSGVYVCLTLWTGTYQSSMTYRLAGHCVVHNGLGIVTPNNAAAQKDGTDQVG